MSLRTKLELKLEKWHIRFNWHWEVKLQECRGPLSTHKKSFMTMDVSKIGNEKRGARSRNGKGKIGKNRKSWKGKLIITAKVDEEVNKNKTKYIFFVLIYSFFTSSSPFSLMSSLPFHDFLKVIIALIQVYNWKIRHHALVCRCGLAEILFFEQNRQWAKWSYW